jgi:hypothetical protein
MVEMKAAYERKRKRKRKSGINQEGKNASTRS